VGMNRPFAPGVFALALALASCSAPDAPGPGPGSGGPGAVPEIPPLRQLLPAGSVALLHAAILEPSTGMLTPGQTVLISGDRIVAVGADGTLAIPAGAISVDAAGRTLLPGLVDSHVHARSADLAAYVDEGITTVRNLWGLTGMLEAAAALVRDGAVAPSIESASPGIDGPGSPWPQTQLITDPAAAEALVAGLAGQGWRWLKVYSHLDAAVFDAVADAANAHGIRFLGHVPFSVPLQHALDRRMLSIEHLTGYELALGGTGSPPAQRWASMDIDRMPSIAAATAAAGTWNCPTMTVVQVLTLDDPDGPEASRRRRLLVGELFKAGARLLAGTDSGIDKTRPGTSLHDELDELVASGLTPLDALRAATTWPAEFLERVGEIGTVSPGARADLVLVDGDPRDDVGVLRHPRAVMLRGAWLERP
jgi:imidazolonepropionase-like amidohydrolase